VVSARGRKPSTATGTLLGLGLVTAVTAVLVPVEGHVTRATPALALVLPVALAALVGRRPAALLTAFAAAAALNLAFIPPRWTPKINSVDDAVAFAVFVVIALVVGTLVAWEADRRVAAEQRTAEIQALHLDYERVVAERERLTEESHRLALLSRIDEQRRALLRSVSHDLRTPLAAIRAATSDMRSGAAYDDATRDELLDLVGDEAERLDRLVANLLSLSRIEAGALEPDRQAVAIDELVADRVRRLARLFRHVSVVDDVPFGLPLVDADYSQIDQVLTNLLENAARHSPPDFGTIRVGARAGDGHVEVWVTDQGAGVDLDRADELFEPFRRGPGSESSGIGLAICRAIAEAHDGRIGVRAGARGGAEFWFTLPVRGD
jgi:two-component system sensor histidine kinase KdpD